MSKKFDLTRFNDVPYDRRATCLICGQKMPAPLIRLPSFPMTGVFAPHRIQRPVGFVDQAFCLCEACGHGQLSNVIDEKLQYSGLGAYSFRTGASETAKDSTRFFTDFIDRVAGKRRFRHIVEIGCNDLFLLKSLRGRAKVLTGIDPILKDLPQKSLPPGIRVIGDFFENVRCFDKTDMVICKDTIEHVRDPKAFVRKIVDQGTTGTIFFFQFPCLETLLEGCRFDQVFHQHLNYFSLASVSRMLDDLDCEWMDHCFNPNLWGALLIAFRKRPAGKAKKPSFSFKKISRRTVLERYAVFQKNMEATRERLKCFEGQKIYGYGAALMLPVLDYHLKGALDGLDCVVDDDRQKENMFYINLPLAIVHSSRITDLSRATVLITAIFSSDNVRKIVSRLSVVNPRNIIVPLNIF